MPNCPICHEEHSPFLNLSRHMVLYAFNHRGDHERYLVLLTGQDMSVWGNRKDAAIARLMQKYYRKLRRLPLLEELEEREDGD